jgi:patatin-like phospholipase/acyl hydrolase
VAADSCVAVQAVRASSAAPYYLDDFLTADGKRFQDGATTANNPTVIALQQARLLHPQVSRNFAGKAGASLLGVTAT